MLAILEAKKAGLLQSKHWLNNIIAGVIVGVVALPNFQKLFCLVTTRRFNIAVKRNKKWLLAASA